MRYENGKEDFIVELLCETRQMKKWTKKKNISCRMKFTRTNGYNLEKGGRKIVYFQKKLDNIIEAQKGVK